MALDFPSSPSNGDYYFSNTLGVFYVYDSTKSVWTVADTGSNFNVGDANTLEGEPGAYYLNYNNFTNTPNITSAARLSLSVTGDGSYDNSTGVITINDSPYLQEIGGVTGNVSNEQLGLAVVQAGFLDTYNVIESTNLYYSNARVQEYLNATAGDIIPDLSEVRSLGSHTYRWANIYLSGNSIFLGNAVITNDGGSIKFGEVEANGYVVPTFNDVGKVFSVNGEVGNVVLTTANVEESGNLYYTDERVYSNIILLDYDTASNVSATIASSVGAAVDEANNFVKESVANTFFMVSLSNEIDALEAGNKITFRAPYALNLYQIPRAYLNTASTSGVVQVDIFADEVSILSTKLTIDANESTSKTAATPAVLSTTTINDDAQITMSILQAGTNANGLKVALYYSRVF